MDTLSHLGNRAFLAVALALTATLFSLTFLANAQDDHKPVAPLDVRHRVVNEAAWSKASASPVRN